MNTQNILYAVLIMFVATLDAKPITYVDAVVGQNTEATSGADLSTWYTDASNSSAKINDQWALRSGASFGNGANDVLQAHSTATNLIPELKTTISGLVAGQQYKVYVFFWDANSGEAWNVDAGLASEALMTFSGEGDGVWMTANTGYAADLENDPNVGFTTDVLTGDSNPNNGTGEADNRDMLYAMFGPVVANPDGEIDVYVDNTISKGGNRRSWYDGVGYVSIPEPGDAGLFVGFLGLSLTMLRQRRK